MRNARLVLAISATILTLLAAPSGPASATNPFEAQVGQNSQPRTTPPPPGSEVRSWSSYEGSPGSVPPLASVKSLAGGYDERSGISTYPIQPKVPTLEGEAQLARLNPETYIVDSAALQASSSQRSDPGVGPAAVAGYAPITYSECQSNPSLSNRPGGWIKNHYTWCQIAYGGEVYFNSSGTAIDSVSYRITVLGGGSNGARSVAVSVKIDNITFMVNGNGYLKQGSALVTLATGAAPSGSCINSNTVGVGRRYTLWATNPEATFTLTSPQASTPSPDFIGLCAFRPNVYMNASATNGVAPDGTGVRFDTGRSMSPASGAIFDRVVGTIAFSQSPVGGSVTASQGVQAVAKHIQDALTNPASTFPPGPKTVPSLLTRSTDGTLIDANRARSRAVCTQFSGAYNGAVLNCDEYPPASTRQGARNAGNNFSARVLNAIQNQRAGRQLGAFYNADRIIDGAQFFVRVTGTIRLPDGSFDLLGIVNGSQLFVGGWAADINSGDINMPGKDVEIHVYVTGPNGQLGYPGIIASGARPDVASAFPWAGGTTGFSTTVPSQGAGINQVCVYAIETVVGVGNRLLGCRSIEVLGSCLRPDAAVDNSGVNPDIRTNLRCDG